MKKFLTEIALDEIRLLQVNLRWTLLEIDNWTPFKFISIAKEVGGDTCLRSTSACTNPYFKQKQC